MLLAERRVLADLCHETEVTSELRGFINRFDGGGFHLTGQGAKGPERESKWPTSHSPACERTSGSDQFLTHHELPRVTGLNSVVAVMTTMGPCNGHCVPGSGLSQPATEVLEGGLQDAALTSGGLPASFGVPGLAKRPQVRLHLLWSPACVHSSLSRRTPTRHVGWRATPLPSDPLNPASPHHQDPMSTWATFWDTGGRDLHTRLAGGWGHHFLRQLCRAEGTEVFIVPPRSTGGALTKVTDPGPGGGTEI